MLPGTGLVRLGRFSAFSRCGGRRGSPGLYGLALLGAACLAPLGGAEASEGAGWSAALAEAMDAGDCARQWELSLAGISSSQPSAWDAVDAALVCYRKRSCADALGLLPDLPDDHVQSWRRRGDGLTTCAPDRWRDAYQAYQRFVAEGGDPAEVDAAMTEIEDTHLATLSLSLVAPEGASALRDAVRVSVDGAQPRLRRAADPGVRILAGLEPGPSALRLFGEDGTVLPARRDLVLERGSNALALALIQVHVPPADGRLAVRLRDDPSAWGPAAAAALAVPGTYTFVFGEGEQSGVYAADLLDDGDVVPLPWAVELASDGVVLWRDTFGPRAGALQEVRGDLKYPPTFENHADARWTAEFSVGSRPGAYVEFDLDGGAIPGAAELREIESAKRARKRSLAGAIAGYVVSGVALGASGGLYGAALNQAGIAADASSRADFDAATGRMQVMYAGSAGALGAAVVALATAVGVDVHSSSRKRRAAALHAAAVKTPLSLRGPASEPAPDTRARHADDAVADAPAAVLDVGGAQALPELEPPPRRTPAQADGSPAASEAPAAPAPAEDPITEEGGAEQTPVAEPAAVAAPPVDDPATSADLDGGQADGPAVTPSGPEGADVLPPTVQVSTEAPDEPPLPDVADAPAAPPLRKRVDARYPEVLRRIHKDRIVRCTGVAQVSPKGRPEGLSLECPLGFHLVAAGAVSRWRWERHDADAPTGAPIEVIFRKGRPTSRAGITWIENPESVLGDDAPAQLASGRMPRHPPQVSAGRAICVADLEVSRRGGVRSARVDGCARPYRKMAESAVRSWRFYAPGDDGAQVRVLLGFDI